MKRKILIVEDNISLSQMQKDWFAQAGYDVGDSYERTDSPFTDTQNHNLI